MKTNIELETAIKTIAAETAHVLRVVAGLGMRVHRLIPDPRNEDFRQCDAATLEAAAERLEELAERLPSN